MRHDNAIRCRGQFRVVQLHFAHEKPHWLRRRPRVPAHVLLPQLHDQFPKRHRPDIEEARDPVPCRRERVEEVSVVQPS